MRQMAVAVIVAMSASGSLYASDDLDSLQNLGPAQFRILSEDLGAALTYRAIAPSEPLGITGFDINVGVTTTKVQDSIVWDVATGGDGPNYLVVPAIRVQKGLPFDIDVGAMYSSVPDSNVKLLGAEIKYAMIKGGAATPAVALRVSYTELDGVNQLDFNTTGYDISISKGFAFLTPYAGVGRVRVQSTPQAEAAAIGLKEEKFSLSRYFIGLNMNFGLINFAFEGDKTDENTTYGAKVGFRF